MSPIEQPELPLTHERPNYADPEERARRIMAAVRSYEERNMAKDGETVRRRWRKK